MRFLLGVFLAGFLALSAALAHAADDPLAALIAEAGGADAVMAASTTPTPETYSAQNPPPKPKALKDVEASGGQMRYLGTYAGLQGWVAIRQGQPEYYYVTADGKGVLMGILFEGETGGLVTGQQLQAMKDVNPTMFSELMGLSQQNPAAPSTTATAKAADVKDAVTAQATAPKKELSSPSDVLIKMLDDAAGFTIGAETAPKMYAFLDPECPHCKRFLSTLLEQKYIADKKIALKVIPVAKSAQSTQKAAYLLAIPNAAEVLLTAVKKPEVYDAMPKDLATAGVERNVQLLLKLKFNMTPSFVYRNTAGEVKVVRGLPNDIGPMLLDLGTLSR